MHTRQLANKTLIRWKCHRIARQCKHIIKSNTDQNDCAAVFVDETSSVKYAKRIYLRATALNDYLIFIGFVECIDRHDVHCGTNICNKSISRNICARRSPIIYADCFGLYIYIYIGNSKLKENIDSNHSGGEIITCECIS